MTYNQLKILSVYQASGWTVYDDPSTDDDVGPATNVLPPSMTNGLSPSTAHEPEIPGDTYGLDKARAATVDDIIKQKNEPLTEKDILGTGYFIPAERDEHGQLYKLVPPENLDPPQPAYPVTKERAADEENPFRMHLTKDGMMKWRSLEVARGIYIAHILKITVAMGRSMLINSGTHGDKQGMTVVNNAKQGDIALFIQDLKMTFKLSTVAVFPVSSLRKPISSKELPTADIMDGWCYGTRTDPERWAPRDDAEKAIQTMTQKIHAFEETLAETTQKIDDMNKRLYAGQFLGGESLGLTPLGPDSMVPPTMTVDEFVEKNMTLERLELTTIDLKNAMFRAYKTQNHVDTLLHGRAPLEEVYINLAVVKEKEQSDKEKDNINQTKGANSRTSTLESYEEIYAPKAPIKVNDIFKAEGKKSCRRVVVLGRPAIGKTTFVKHLKSKFLDAVINTETLDPADDASTTTEVASAPRTSSKTGDASSPKHASAPEKTEASDTPKPFKPPLFLNQFEWVFSIDIRQLTDKNYPPGQTYGVEDIILKECFGQLNLGNRLSQAEKKYAIKTILENMSHKVLFIFDGADEDKFIPDYIKPVLTHMMSETVSKNAIITSRPYNLENIPLGMDKKLEIIGFTNDNIKAFVEKSVRKFLTEVYSEKELPEDVSLEEKIKQVTQQFLTFVQRPILKGLAHIPLNLELLVSICEKHWTDIDSDGEDAEADPLATISTATDIYENLIQLFSDRLLERRHKDPDAIDLTTSETNTLVDILALVAFQGIQAGKGILIDPKVVSRAAKMVLKQQQATKQQASQASVSFENILDMGLAKSVGKTKYDKDKPVYFAHLTIQEYLAALYISKQTPAAIESFVLKVKYDPQYQVILKFLSGLLYKQENADESFSTDFFETAELTEADEHTQTAVPTQASKQSKSKLLAFFKALTAKPTYEIGDRSLMLALQCLEEIPEDSDVYETIEDNHHLLDQLEDYVARKMKLYFDLKINEKSAYFENFSKFLSVIPRSLKASGGLEMLTESLNIKACLLFADMSNADPSIISALVKQVTDDSKIPDFRFFAAYALWRLKPEIEELGETIKILEEENTHIALECLLFIKMIDPIKYELSEDELAYILKFNLSISDDLEEKLEKKFIEQEITGDYDESYNSPNSQTSRPDAYRHGDYYNYFKHLMPEVYDFLNKKEPSSHFVSEVILNPPSQNFSYIFSPNEICFHMFDEWLAFLDAYIKNHPNVIPDAINLFQSNRYCAEYNTAMAWLTLVCAHPISDETPNWKTIFNENVTHYLGPSGDELKQLGLYAITHDIQFNPEKRKQCITALLNLMKDFDYDFYELQLATRHWDQSSFLEIIDEIFKNNDLETVIIIPASSKTVSKHWASIHTQGNRFTENLRKLFRLMADNEECQQKIYDKISNPYQLTTLAQTFIPIWINACTFSTLIPPMKKLIQTLSKNKKVTDTKAFAHAKLNQFLNLHLSQHSQRNFLKDLPKDPKARFSTSTIIDYLKYLSYHVLKSPKAKEILAATAKTKQKIPAPFMRNVAKTVEHAIVGSFPLIIDDGLIENACQQVDFEPYLPYLNNHLLATNLDGDFSSILNSLSAGALFRHIFSKTGSKTGFILPHHLTAFLKTDRGIRTKPDSKAELHKKIQSFWDALAEQGFITINKDGHGYPTEKVDTFILNFVVPQMANLPNNRIEKDNENWLYCFQKYLMSLKYPEYILFKNEFIKRILTGTASLVISKGTAYIVENDKNTVIQLENNAEVKALMTLIQQEIEETRAKEDIIPVTENWSFSKRPWAKSRPLEKPAVKYLLNLNKADRNDSSSLTYAAAACMNAGNYRAAVFLYKLIIQIMIRKRTLDKTVNENIVEMINKRQKNKNSPSVYIQSEIQSDSIYQRPPDFMFEESRALTEYNESSIRIPPDVIENYTICLEKIGLLSDAKLFHTLMNRHKGKTPLNRQSAPKLASIMDRLGQHGLAQLELLDCLRQQTISRIKQYTSGRIDNDSSTDSDSGFSSSSSTSDTSENKEPYVEDSDRPMNDNTNKVHAHSTSEAIPATPDTCDHHSSSHDSGYGSDNSSASESLKSVENTPYEAVEPNTSPSRLVADRANSESKNTNSDSESADSESNLNASINKWIAWGDIRGSHAKLDSDTRATLKTLETADVDDILEAIKNIEARIPIFSDPNDDAEATSDAEAKSNSEQKTSSASTDTDDESSSSSSSEVFQLTLNGVFKHKQAPPILGQLAMTYLHNGEEEDASELIETALRLIDPLKSEPDDIINYATLLMQQAEINWEANQTYEPENLQQAITIFSERNQIELQLEAQSLCHYLSAMSALPDVEESEESSDSESSSRTTALATTTTETEAKTEAAAVTKAVSEEVSASPVQTTQPTTLPPIVANSIRSLLKRILEEFNNTQYAKYPTLIKLLYHIANILEKAQLKEASDELFKILHNAGTENFDDSHFIYQKAHNKIGYAMMSFMGRERKLVDASPIAEKLMTLCAAPDALDPNALDPKGPEALDPETLKDLEDIENLEAQRLEALKTILSTLQNKIEIDMTTFNLRDEILKAAEDIKDSHPNMYTLIHGYTRTP